jgi:F420H(2)-dependent quinone reductase
MNASASRKDFLDRLKQSSEVKITVIGRKTKKRFSIPVWFALDGSKVVLVPMKGSDNNWYKDLEKDPQIELSVDNIVIPSRATLVRDPNQTNKAIEKLRAKYKSMWSESYYTKRDVSVEITM